MAIYLGIDGGGSKTACAVADEVQLLATASAGPSTVVRVGEERAREGLQAAIRAACHAAGVDAASVTRTCVGVAGASVPTVRGAVERIVGECVGGEVQVVGDMEVAMEAALGAAPGVMVIAGTGSIAFARNGEGRTARAGGWGYAISDEGSGHWIGRRAVSAVMRAADEGRAGTLEHEVCRAWQINSRSDLVKEGNRMPPPDFSQLLPAVLAAGKAGDPDAIGVLTDAGTELARLAAIVTQQLWPAECWVRMALAGGVFRHSNLVRQVFYYELRKQRPNSAVSFAVADPVVGALALARRGAGSRP